MKAASGRSLLIVAAVTAILYSAAAAADVDSRQQFSIPRQSLSAALLEFSQQAHIQVMTASADLVNLTSEGASGLQSSRQALDALLRGTGLRFRVISADAVAIEPVKTADAEPVRSTSISYPPRELRLAQADGKNASESTNASAKGSASNSSQEPAVIEEVKVYGRVMTAQDTLRDVPQAISVFDAAQLANTPTITVGDIVRFAPNAVRSGSTLSAFGDNYIIRGFGASQSVNGTRFNRIAHARDTVNVERVEVLMGPASVLYGQMQPGGVINIVTKKPTDTFQWEVGTEFGTFDNRRYTLDVGGPLTDRFRARAMGAYRDSESQIDYWAVQHTFGAVAAEFDITEKMLLSVESLYSRDRWDSFYSGGYAVGLLRPTALGPWREAFNPSEPGVDSAGRSSNDTSLDVVHRFNESFALRASANMTRNLDAHEVRVFPSTLAANGRTLSRNFFVNDGGTEQDNIYQLELTGHVATGPLIHQFAVGAERRRFSGFYRTRTIPGGTIDVYTPVYGTFTVPVGLEFPDSRSLFTANSVYVQDRIKFGERLSAIVGLRYVEGEQLSKFRAITNIETITNFTENDLTTQLGLLYEVTPWMSVYGSHAEAFVPQFGNSAGAQPFPSEESSQIEVGAKFLLGDSGLSASVAAFKIEKTNVLTADPNNPGFQAPLGDVESQGFEASVNGNLLPSWAFGASYGRGDSEVTRNFDGLAGNRLPRSPKNTASLQTRYDFRDGPFNGLGFGGTVEYVDDRFSDTTNLITLPSHTRVDLGVYYRANEKVDFSILLNNVTDERIYTEGVSITRIIIEPGRTFLARFRIRN